MADPAQHGRRCPRGDPVLADTARCYGITGPAGVRRLALRSTSPQIITGMRQALSIGMILMVISEMFAASDGLGFTVVQFQRTFAIAEMWTGITGCVRPTGTSSDDPFGNPGKH